jgi:hypothetical protein
VRPEYGLRLVSYKDCDRGIDVKFNLTEEHSGTNWDDRSTMVPSTIMVDNMMLSTLIGLRL